jgi:hypothetical protein
MKQFRYSLAIVEMHQKQMKNSENIACRYSTVFFSSGHVVVCLFISHIFYVVCHSTHEADIQYSEHVKCSFDSQLVFYECLITTVLCFIWVHVS